MRRSENLSWSRATAFTRENVANFFEILRPFVDLVDSDPDRIFNMDETGTQLNQRDGEKVIGVKGSKRTPKISTAEQGATVSVLFTVGANGQFFPPEVIFGHGRLHVSEDDFGCNCFVHKSENGWTNSDIFVKYLQHFQVNRPKNDQDCLLILDGHASHFSVEAIEFCRSNKIHMLVLPPHCTDKMQPLDTHIFSPFKHQWHEATNTWLRSNPGSKMTQQAYANIFSAAYLPIANRSSPVINGFKSCGILPFEPNVFSDEHFAPSDAIMKAKNNKEGCLGATPNPRPYSAPAALGPIDQPKVITPRFTDFGALNLSTKSLPSPAELVFAKYNPLSNMTTSKPSNRGRKKGTARVATSEESLDLAKTREENRKKRAAAKGGKRGRPKKAL